MVLFKSDILTKWLNDFLYVTTDSVCYVIALPAAIAESPLLKRRKKSMMYLRFVIDSMLKLISMD